jgi:hypothetical protein
MLIENFDNLRESMFSVLAKLCSIPTHNFGLHCFCILREHMLSGNELRERIKYHVDNEIVKKLENDTFDSKTIMLLDGLRMLVEKSGETGLLYPLYQKPVFKKWLRYVSSQLTGKKNILDKTLLKKAGSTKDAIVMLFSVGLQENEPRNLKEI